MRPTTAAFANPARCAEFRQELEALQAQLREYTRMLADVEDLTSLEATDASHRKTRKKHR